MAQGHLTTSLQDFFSATLLVIFLLSGCRLKQMAIYHHLDFPDNWFFLTTWDLKNKNKALLLITELV